MRENSIILKSKSTFLIKTHGAFTLDKKNIQSKYTVKHLRYLWYNKHTVKDLAELLEKSTLTFLVEFELF